MTATHTNDHELILSNNRLAEIADVITRQPSIGLDLEGNGRHRYPESVCLVQISIPGSIYIVDPLSVDDMSPLGNVLSDERIEKILHSADYDIRCLERDWGFRIRNLFDTSIGASLLGLPRTGLGAVLADVIEVDIPKSKRLQKSDWTIRPLGSEALDYAASDVAHLHELREAMRARLDDLGRLHWMAEECERQLRVRYQAPDPQTAFLSIKGSHALDAGGLSVLRELVAMRERHALRRGRPHFHVLANATLIALASEPDADLRKVLGLGPFGRRPLMGELREALRLGLQAPPYERPPSNRLPRMAAPEKKRMDKLKAWRKVNGEELKIDPSLIWPMASLERLAWEPETVDEETRAPEVRRWQAAEFSQSLLKAVAGL
jgi:ribonuclease D